MTMEMWGVWKIKTGYRKVSPLHSPRLNILHIIIAMQWMGLVSTRYYSTMPLPGIILLSLPVTSPLALVSDQCCYYYNDAQVGRLAPANWLAISSRDIHPIPHNHYHCPILRLYRRPIWRTLPNEIYFSISSKCVSHGFGVSSRIADKRIYALKGQANSAQRQRLGLE